MVRWSPRAGRRFVAAVPRTEGPLALPLKAENSDSEGWK